MLCVSNAELAVMSRLLDAAVDRLSKQIRGLTNLTLKITSTQPLSAISRHTAPFYPLPHPLAGGGGAAGVGRIPRCLEPAELLLQLEGSGVHRHQPSLTGGVSLTYRESYHDTRQHIVSSDCFLVLASLA